MSFTHFSSLHFDLAISALTVASFFGKWGAEEGISKGVVAGLQAFSLVALVDRTLRTTLLRNEKKEETSLKKGVMSAFVEEGIYSGILLTQSKMWMIPRLIASLVTGNTAARALIGRIEEGKERPSGLTRDTQIGVAWAIAREAMVLASPTAYSIPLLLAADSVVFALSEVCPSQKNPSLPKGSSAWFYKTLSAAFFRITANTSALATGILSPLTQHLLFNVSRSFPE